MTKRHKLIKDCDALWSKAVKKRCHHKCMVNGCGTFSGDAHHIISRRCNATRFDIDNGIMLCRKHHNHQYHKQMLTRIIERIGFPNYQALLEKARERKVWHEWELEEIKVSLKQELERIKT